MNKRVYASAATLIALSAAVTACGGSSGGSDGTAAGSGDNSDNSMEARDPLQSPIGNEIKCENQYEGKTVTIFSPVRDSDSDNPIADYVAGYDPLVQCTGLTIEWQGTDQFETEINVRLQGGDPPDVIDYPQPGLLKSHIEAGYIQPVSDNVAKATKENFIAGWDSYATVDGKIYGIPGRSNIKSLVWYSPTAFSDGGYEVPETLEAMKDLSDKMVEDGKTPWCVGAESGVATGWVLTDWMEDFMLRVNGEDVYDQWVDHSIPFNDPQVANVADAVGSYVKNPDYLGGENAVKAIATTKFQDGGLPILQGNCYMHRQASFYSSLWPEGTNIAPDGDIWFYYLPSPENGPRYLLGAGDIYAAGTDKPESQDVLLFTGSAEYQGYIVNTRGELSPNKNLDTATIGDPLVKAFSDIQSGADVFRFDGSDLMPGAVGAGSFWTEVTAWVIGSEDTDTFLNNVESSWPSS